MPHPDLLRDLAISDSGFVFDPRTGATFTVNETGLAVLLALREGLASDALPDRVRAAFDAVPASVADDVADFVLSLCQHGLIAPDALARLASPGERS